MALMSTTSSNFVGAAEETKRDLRRAEVRPVSSNTKREMHLAEVRFIRVFCHCKCHDDCSVSHCLLLVSFSHSSFDLYWSLNVTNDANPKPDLDENAAPSDFLSRFSGLRHGDRQSNGTIDVVPFEL